MIAIIVGFYLLCCVPAVLLVGAVFKHGGAADDSELPSLLRTQAGGEE